MYWFEFAGNDDILAALEATTAVSSPKTTTEEPSPERTTAASSPEGTTGASPAETKTEASSPEGTTAASSSEAPTAAAELVVVGPGIATAADVNHGRVPSLALTHAVGEVIGTGEATLAGARSVLTTADFSRSGSVAVRARDVRSTTGVDTEAVEEELGAQLVAAGFTVDLTDPDHVCRVLFGAGPPGRDKAADPADPLDPVGTGHVASAVEDDGICVVGWQTATSVRDFGDRMPSDRPFFQPGSMDPQLARVVANLAGAGPGTHIVDPLCGTGGLLIEAAAAGASVLGSDAQHKMVAGARQNLQAAIETEQSQPFAEPADWEVLRADATALPYTDAFAAGVVCDVPYERQSLVAGEDLAELVEGALVEARRIAPQAVVVADREWTDAARAAGWTVETMARSRVHRSLTRHIHLLSTV